MNKTNEFFKRLDKISAQLEEQKKQMDSLMIELRLNGVEKLSKGVIPDFDYTDDTWSLVYDDEGYDLFF